MFNLDEIITAMARVYNVNIEDGCPKHLAVNRARDYVLEMPLATDDIEMQTEQFACIEACATLLSKLD